MGKIPVLFTQIARQIASDPEKFRECYARAGSIAFHADGTVKGHAGVVITMPDITV